MGKAYTEEEKEEIKRKIWEEALEIMHDGKRDKLSMRELTVRVGISLGSFYNFYKDKESLIQDVMRYRASQKLECVRERFSEAEKNPAVFVSKQILQNVKEMGYKIRNQEIYRDSLQSVMENESDWNVLITVYRSFLEELRQYLEKKQVAVSMDIEGVLAVIRSAISFFRMMDAIEEQYFEELLELLVKHGCERYICVEK